MSIMSDVYTKLNVSTINDLVNDVSPYVRARGTDFPAVLFSVPSQDFERISTGNYRVASSVEVVCVARSVTESETIATAVLALLDGTCDVVDSVTREYEEGYDEDSVGVFSVIINFTNYGGA